MTIAIQITGITNTAILAEATDYIGQHLIMSRESIVTALGIPGFIFYSKKFAAQTFTGYSFTITPLNLSSDIYINTAGTKLEVPVIKNGDNIVYEKLETSKYIEASAIDSDVQDMIDKFVLDRFLYKFLYVPGDFNNDFNEDYLI